MPPPTLLSPTPGIRGAALLALLGLAALLGSASHAAKGKNDGVFQDRDGRAHAWSLERSHLLVWDGKPYAPAGIVFRSAYLRSPSPESLQEDQSALERLQAAGVQDLWIDPQRGLLQNTLAQTQALLDAVEARGLRYGLRVGDRSREPLIGYSPTVAPVRVPVERLQPGAQLSLEIPAPRGRRAAFTLAEVGADEKQYNWAIATGEALVERDRARVQVKLRNSRLLGKSRGMLFVVPEVQVEPEELGSFGDLWTGMEAYSERLRLYVRALKFGPGFRFLLDPFAAGDGTVGQEDLVFPSSDSFRRAFAEWLQKRSGVSSVNILWRLNDRRLATIEEAARLVPTWPRNDPPDGDGWLIDPVDQVAYRCTARQSGIWQDLENFRADALKRWMNSVTTALRKEGPNVPTLFTWSAYHPVFTNAPSPAGYDGLAAQLSGSPADIARASAAYALAQVEESDRNTWLVAALLAGPTGSDGEPGALPENQVRPMWEAIREVGFRGFYLDPALTPGAEGMARGLAAQLAAEDPELRKTLSVCFFPMALSTAERITRLSNGVWWLPSGASARLLRYGDTFLGYEIDQPFGEDHPVRHGTVLWSTRGAQELTFFVDRLTNVMFYDSTGAAIKLKGSARNQRKITLTEEPVVATGIDTTQLFPFELAAAYVRELGTLIDMARERGADTAALRVVLDDARRTLTPASAAVVYNTVLQPVLRLREQLMPYLWVEGEHSAAHNFTGTTFRAGCSSGTYLRLDRAAPPAFGVYKSRYVVMVPQDASYELWAAGRVPGRPGVSPLVWQVDDEPASELPRGEAVGPDYAGGMAWFRLGRVTLQAGRHVLTLVVPEKADSGRFSAGVDALVLSRSPFQPRGSEKPAWIAAARESAAESAERQPGEKKAEGKKSERKKSDDKKRGGAAGDDRR